MGQRQVSSTTSARSYNGHLILSNDPCARGDVVSPPHGGAPLNPFITHKGRYLIDALLLSSPSKLSQPSEEMSANVTDVELVDFKPDDDKYDECATSQLG